MVEFDGELSTEDSKEIFANFGLAIHVSNVLEFSILNALFVTELVPKIRDYSDPEKWGAAYDEFFENGFSQSFGNLLKRLLVLEVLSEEAANTLKSSKKVRDHLVHHFMRESAELIYNASGRRRMIEECENAVALFDAGHVEVENYTTSKFEELGIDPKRWNEKIVSEMNRWVRECRE